MKDIFNSYYDPIDMSCCVSDSESLENLQSKMVADKIYFPFYQKGYSLRDILNHGNYETYSYRYGTLADNVLGVLFENKNGVQLKIGARVVKNVTGFDFTRFFTQNENEFGKIKKAILRLRPKPEIISKYIFIHHIENCDKLIRTLLHSTWATSLMGLDFVADEKMNSVEISVGGTPAEEEIIKLVLEDFARKCDGTLFKKLEVETVPLQFSVQGNLLLSKNIRFGDYLIKKFGGQYKGLLGNGYFLYLPRNFEEFSKCESDINQEIKKISGSIFWQGQKNPLENLADIRQKLLLAMKEIR